MPDLLTIGAGIASGLEKATANLMNIQMARYKLKQEDELMGLKKKAIEKDLALMPFEREKLLQDIDSSKAKIGYYSALAKQKDEETRKTVTQLSEFQKNLAAAQNAQGEVKEGYGINYGGGMAIRRNNPKEETKKDEVSYTDEFRSALQDATQRIGNGEDYKLITNELMQKYPDKMTWTVTGNLEQVAKQAKISLNQYRNQAIQELRKSKYPVTENNINAAIKQLRGQ